MAENLFVKGEVASADKFNAFATELEGYRDDAAGSAADSANSASESAASAITAAEFGDNKLTFTDTTSGLAGTTSGQYFRVPQGVGNTLAFKYYKNNSGTAVEVAEYVGQGSISNSIRAYAALSAAQADVLAGNILNGSYCLVLNSANTTIYDEYLCSSGSLSVTGRTVPTQAAIDAVNKSLSLESTSRGRLITPSGTSKISLTSGDGFEIGQIGETGISVKNFGFKQSTGNLLELDNGQGFKLPIYDLSGRLIAGGGKITETPPGWQSVTMTPLGWVISGVQDDGTVYVGKDNGGGGNVEPTPSVLETTAVGHWLFGYETTSYNSRVSSQVLTPQSTPVFNKNYVSLAAWGGALVSGIADAGEYTVCSVVRIPTQASETDCVVIYGTADGYSQRDDDNTYSGVQLSLFSDRDTRRWLRSKVSGYRATSRRYPADLSPVGKWLFISHTVRVTGTGQRYQFISVSGSNYNMLREADSNRVNLSGRNIAVGNGYCDSAIFKTKQLDIAEFIYFNSALTIDQIRTVYFNSRQRMAERSLNLQ
ncbi:LamG domain-containing protein [Klebsiella variicola]|uniref:hypothetical protein n=1 Tax=Klebsiella variicola TaxID=244366 RepID=UPI00109B9056|nr:hypothetical protein [Klebsiella variicola]VGP70902.1 hypothetical protein SB5387_01001 [Klebsiella variicola]